MCGCKSVSSLPPLKKETGEEVEGKGKEGEGDEDEQMGAQEGRLLLGTGDHRLADGQGAGSCLQAAVVGHGGELAAALADATSEAATESGQVGAHFLQKKKHHREF